MSIHRLALINPNTNAATTAAMTAIAEEAAAGSATITGISAPFGAPLITNAAALEIAADAVMALTPDLRAGRFGGVIVAAFGDPAVLALRDAVDIPVTGIAEAGMAAAAMGGRVFSVVTTTPDLVDAITNAAQRYGHGAEFRGVRLTPGDPASLMAEPERLLDAMALACQGAIDDLGAEAIVIGGGPLARVARILKDRFAIPIIEPVPEAVRLALRRVGDDTA